MADIQHQGIRTIGQVAEFLVHHLERRPTLGPHIDFNCAAREDLLHPPCNDLSHGEPRVVRLAAGARLSDHQEIERSPPAVRIRYGALEAAGESGIACAFGPKRITPADRSSRRADRRQIGAPVQPGPPGSGARLEEGECKQRRAAEQKQPRLQRAFPPIRTRKPLLPRSSTHS